jgi:opacity protein-like surface antigen
MVRILLCAAVAALVLIPTAVAKDSKPGGGYYRPGGSYAKTDKLVIRRQPFTRRGAVVEDATGRRIATCWFSEWSKRLVCTGR